MSEIYDETNEAAEAYEVDEVNEVEYTDLEETEEIDVKYSKQAYINSDEFKKYRDVLYALLEDDIKYTKKEVDIKIKKFLEGEVN